MALNFDVGKIKNNKVLTSYTTESGREIWHPSTDKLIWACLAVGMGKITKENWKEFYKRLVILERLERSPYHTEPLEVYMHIGLSTNVSDEPYNKWLKRVTESISRDYIMWDIDKVPSKYEEYDIETMTAERWQAISDAEGNTLAKRIEAVMEKVDG